MTSRIVTFQILLHDEPGQLAEILDVFGKSNANIISINSVMPSNGTGVVTISAETMELTVSLEAMLHQLADTRGVVKAEVLAG